MIVWMGFEQLFNSYYNTVGQPFPRHRRGQISRPGLHEILEYRQHVENAVAERFQNGDWRDSDLNVLELGLQHEQQHQGVLDADQQLPDGAGEFHARFPQTGQWVR